MEIKKSYQKKRTGPQPAKGPECVYSYAIWYLGRFGENSEKQIRDKMKNKTDNQEWIDIAMNKIIDQGYQSDSRYAEMIVRKGLGSKAWGKSRIKNELRSKGILTDTIEDAMELLNDDDPLSRAHEALGKKFRGKEIVEKKDYGKATRFLSVHGFGFDHIRSAIKLHNENLLEIE